MLEGGLQRAWQLCRGQTRAAYRAAVKEQGEGSEGFLQVLAEGPFHPRSRYSYLNEVTREHGTVVDAASVPVLPAPPKAARRQLNTCPWRWDCGCPKSGCQGGRACERNWEYRAGALIPELQENYAGPVPEHVLYRRPTPAFDWGAYFDRQFDRAKAPNELRADDSDD